jgi:hypothetical protein
MSTHSSKDRASLCSFSFADGRRCRIPRCSAHPHLCYFHARKEAQALAAQQVGRDISSCLSNSYLSACDLSSALGQVFSAVAQGQIKPKTATTLAYLGQTLLQSIHVAQHEYINAFDTDSWRDVIRASFAVPSSDDESDTDAETDSDADLESEAELGFVPSAGTPSK